MVNNLLVLEGTVCKSPNRKQSPSGIDHCQFVVEHQSQQFEAQLPRRAWLRIQVVVSGEQAQPLTESLFVGCPVRVSGFLNRHETKDGTGKLVLHAHNIERMN